MKLPKNLTFDIILSAAEEDDNIGFCLNCGEEVYDVEPDARRYTCENCNSPCVYGAAEILLGI